MQIALFGGAFDPPHLGHQQIAESLISQKIVDEVWFVPTGVHDFGKNMTSAEHRVAMLKLMIDGKSGSGAKTSENLAEDKVSKSPKTRVEDCELKRKGVSYSIDTLNQLSAEYPEHEFSWVIGSDNLESFHLWGDYEAMLEKYNFYAYPRKGFAMKPLYEGMIALENMKEVEISSTEVREKIKKGGKSVDDLVDSRVRKYIEKYGLYK